MIQQVCAENDYNASTHTCTDPYFTESESILTSLTIEEANALLGATLTLWAIAWVLRRLIKVVSQS